jgi:hypothetical protein
MISESESHAMQIVRRWLKKRKPFVEIELVFICTPLLIHCFFFLCQHYFVMWVLTLKCMMYISIFISYNNIPTKKLVFSFLKWNDRDFSLEYSTD